MKEHHMRVYYNTAQYQSTTFTRNTGSMPAARQRLPVQGRAKQPLTAHNCQAYALSRRCKFNGTGLAARNTKGGHRHSAVFLCPQHGSTCNGRCRVGGLRACRFFGAGLLTHTAPPSLFSSGGAVNKPHQRYPAMTQRHTLTLNPFKSLAARYRAKALSALHADSSLSVRLARYNAAITKARQLEALASTTKPAQAGGAA